jgi:cystathionine gamma-synthase
MDQSASMTTLAVEKKFGHSTPPYGPHTITAHLPKWMTLVNFRNGDKSLMPLLKSIYPRFAPWGHARQVRICTLTGLSCGNTYSHTMAHQSWS